MSWSFYGIGKPDALSKKLDADLAQMSDGQSKEEFSNVVPHLQGLLRAAHVDAAVHVEANGHMSFVDGKRTFANVFVKIQQLGPLVE